MEKDMLILPKGTKINLNGFIAELVQDTPVLSESIKAIGLENVQVFISHCPASPIDDNAECSTNPYSQISALSR
jgi:hypothetical protein